MSRINDALKKARQAHAATPSTAAGPELRPLRNPAGKPPRAIITRPLIIVVAVLLVGVACWIWLGLNGNELVVRANSLPATSVPPTTPAVEASTPSATTTISNAEPPLTVDVAAAPIETPAPAGLVAASGPAIDISAAPLPPAVKARPIAEISIPAPTTLTLQGLLFRPKNPIAIINGETVSVGSQVGDARVVAIDLHSVTVTTATGQTNILEMAGR